MIDQNKAALWMCGGVLSFSLMAISGRELSSELSTSQFNWLKCCRLFSDGFGDVPFGMETT